MITHTNAEPHIPDELERMTVKRGNSNSSKVDALLRFPKNTPTVYGLCSTHMHTQEVKVSYIKIESDMQVLLKCKDDRKKDTLTCS